MLVQGLHISAVVITKKYLIAIKAFKTMSRNSESNIKWFKNHRMHKPKREKI